MINMKLQHFLDEQKISRRELSRQVNIRQSTINDYCNNTFKSISKENLEKLCKHFECSVNDLIEYKKED